MATGHCANCDAALAGPYCHACGQSAEPPTRSVGTLLREVVGDVTRLDSRALRSATFLLVRPGFLTREYLAGRRVRYTPPFQLYLAAAAVFFLVNAYRPFVTFDPDTLRIASSLHSAAAALDLTEAELAARAPGLSPELFGERFQATVTGYLPTFLIGIVLLFALLLSALYRRSGRTYLEHAVFALHWAGFYFLLMIIDRLVPAPAGQANATGAILAAITFTYLAIALRTVYERGWPATVLAALGLSIAFQLLIIAWMLSAAALAFAVI